MSFVSETDGLKAIAANRLASGEPDRRRGFGQVPVFLPARPAVQRKLAVGRENDPLEDEADRVAEQLMRMPAPVSTPGAAACASCECAGCADQEKASTVRLKRSVGAVAGDSEEVAPEMVRSVLRTSGRPLDPATAAYFQPRLGRDLSHVRVHTDGDAARSAELIAARAYTAGNHIVFARGHHDPASFAGGRLLAHELVHVVQQGGGGSPKPAPANARIQRACGPAIATAVSDCSPSDDSDMRRDFDWRFRFVVNCDDLLPGEARRISAAAALLAPGTELKIHGYASEDGPAAFNLALSCRRAKLIANELRFLRPDCTISDVLMHGELGDRPNRDFYRAVEVERLMPKKKPVPKQEDCGALLGNCEFYKCRERLQPCGAKGYYEAYGYKYCQRFSQLAPSMSPAGKSWVSSTLRCLIDHVHYNIPVNASCARSKKSAFDSHPACYVKGGVCSLGPWEGAKILDTIDPADLDVSQAFHTAAACVANWGAMLVPGSLLPGGGYRGIWERDQRRNRQQMQPPR